MIRPSAPGYDRKDKIPVRPISDSGLSGCDIRSDHIQVVAGGFESLFGIVLRNKPRVVIEGQIALPAETIKDSQQTGMFLVDTRLHKIDDGDVVPGWLLARNPWLNMKPSEALSMAS